MTNILPSLVLTKLLNDRKAVWSVKILVSITFKDPLLDLNLNPWKQFPQLPGNKCYEEVSYLLQGCLARCM